MTEVQQGVAWGLIADAIFGEPPTNFHPVVHFGSSMTRLELRMNNGTRASGALFAALGVGGAVILGMGLDSVAGPKRAATLSAALCSASKSLFDHAASVSAALENTTLPAARVAAGQLVGRSTKTLDASEIARACVESVAENLSDAVVGTALWGMLFGAPGMLAHRSANTLDAMVGYRNDRFEHFGWASARLDDLLGALPARLTGLLVMLAAPKSAKSIVGAIRTARHPSPNAGIVEAAFAGALTLRLGGTNTYGGHTEQRPILGSGRAVTPSDIDRAVGLAKRVVALVVALGLMVAAIKKKKTTS